MTELEKFHAVNKCETPEDIYDVILSFADANGYIQGRTRSFDANQMVKGASFYFSDLAAPNVLTREFGIRQQAMYIKFYMT